MSFARRLHLDLSPAFFALRGIWGMREFCVEYSDANYPWPVNSAHLVGFNVSVLWWVWSDAVRRPFPLLPVWGAWIVLAGLPVTVIYLFASRGWWGFMTLLLYGLAFSLTGFLIRLLV